MRYVILIIVFALFSLPVKAEEIIELTEGVMPVSLSGGDSKEIIVKAWREHEDNYGYHVISIYKEQAGHLLTTPHTMRPSYRPSCVIRDYHLLNKDGKTYIIEVENTGGKTYLKKHVLFEKKTTVIGRSILKLEVIKKLELKEKYCNALKALKDNSTNL